MDEAIAFDGDRAFFGPIKSDLNGSVAGDLRKAEFYSSGVFDVPFRGVFFELERSSESLHDRLVVIVNEVFESGVDSAIGFRGTVGKEFFQLVSLATQTNLLRT